MFSSISLICDPDTIALKFTDACVNNYNLTARNPDTRDECLLESVVNGSSVDYLINTSTNWYKY